MFKVYVFAAMLKAAHNVTIKEFSEKQDDMLGLIPISPYISLVHQYLDKEWPVPYSIPHMLQEVFSSNLVPTNKRENTEPIKFKDIVISASPLYPVSPNNIVNNSIRALFSRATLYDDKVYDSGFSWWITAKNRTIGREILLKTGREGFRISIPCGESGPQEYLDTSREVKDWLIYQWKGIDTIYRIFSGDKLTCFGVEGDQKDFGIQKSIPLTDGYVKYISEYR